MSEWLKRTKRIALRALTAVGGLTVLAVVVNSMWPATCGISYYYVSLSTGKLTRIDQGLFLWSQRVYHFDTRLSRMLEKYHTESESDKGPEEFPSTVLVARSEVGLLYYSGFRIMLHEPYASDFYNEAFKKAGSVARVLEMCIENGLVTEAESESILCEALLYFRRKKVGELEKRAHELLDRLEEAHRSK